MFFVLSHLVRKRWTLFSSCPSQGPPQCPPEVNVTGQTSHSVTLTWLVGHNGGAPQTFVIFYNYNTSSNVQMWHRNNVSSPDNTTTVSDTVEHLPANTSILFQVVGVNKFNEDSVDVSMCAAPTWARTCEFSLSFNSKRRIIIILW